MSSLRATHDWSARRLTVEDLQVSTMLVTEGVKKGIPWSAESVGFPHFRNRQNMCAVKRNIRDLMVPLSECPVVGTKDSLREAVARLSDAFFKEYARVRFRTILVMDKEEKLVGILDFWTLLESLIPEYCGGLSEKFESTEVTISFAEADTLELDEARLPFSARVMKEGEKQVKDIMLKVKGTIQADCGLSEAVRIKCANKVTVLPVYEGNTLVGVLRDVDVFLMVAEFFGALKRERRAS